MKKKHIATLLFFLCLFGVVVIAMQAPPEENAPLNGKDKVILSLKEKTASIIDKIKGADSDNDNPSSTDEKQENIVVDKIITPTQETINITKEKTTEKIEQIIETITTPIKNTTNSLAKQLIEWLLSLLSPEEIRDIFEGEFNIDICK